MASNQDITYFFNIVNALSDVYFWPWQSNGNWICSVLKETNKNNNYIYTYIHTHTQQFADTGQQEVQETILFEKESKARALVYFLEILGNRKWR